MNGDGAEAGIVVFGDVVGSRRVASQAGVWLRRLCQELDERYGADRIASFGFTQGDELQGLLRPGADPLVGVLHASLHEAALPMRWVVVVGAIAAGEGPATERSGDAFVRARAEIERARRQRDGLLMVTGATPPDALLDDLAPVLAEELGRLSPRQRTIARMAILEGLRQSDIADALGVSRATVSVTWARAGVRSIDRLSRAVRTIFASGVEAT